MKNIEMFEDVLISIISQGKHIAINKHTNAPMQCNASSYKCLECKFYNNDSYDCNAQLHDWMNEEYTPNWQTTTENNYMPILVSNDGKSYKRAYYVDYDGMYIIAVLDNPQGKSMFIAER